MKFLHYALLIAGASAMKLKQMTTIALDKKVDEVTEAEWKELGDALYSYTADGETLSYPEMEKEVVDWATKNDVEPFKGWKKALKHIFKMIDTNGDKEISRKEADKVIDEHEDVQIGSMATLLTKDPMDDIEAGVKAELEKDGGLTLKELNKIIEDVADKYDFTLPEGWKQHVKKMFDWVDANHDGTVTGPEIEAAMAKAGEKKEDDLVQLKAHLKSALGDEPTEEQWQELGKAIFDETEGDETLELGELYGLITKWAKKHDLTPPKGWKKDVKKMFDYVDANNDGHVTRDELKAAFEKHEDDMDVQLQTKLKSTLRLGEGPSKEQWQELGKAIWDSTAGDDTLEKDELISIIAAWADKHDFTDKLPKGWKEYVGKLFDYVDANSDGHVTRDELEAAMKKHK